MQPEHENINGEHGAILKEIHLLGINVEVLKTRQQDIYKKMDKLDNLPCERHIEKFTQYDNTRKVLAGTIFGVVCLIVTFACAWGALNNDVKIHHERAKKVWEKCCAGNY